MHPLAAPPRRLILALILLAALLVGTFVVWTGSAETSDAGPGVEGEGAQGPASTTTAPPEPDVLDDPGVAPGSCEIVTYTPDTAATPKQGQLCRPAGEQRDVAIVAVHGGSGISGSYHSLEGWSRRLLAEGYVTFLTSYHLFTPGSGESPVFPRPEQNIKAAVQYLRGTGNALGIDKDRIVVQGHSAGARVGAVVATTPDDPAFAGPELHPGVADRVDAFIGFYHPYDGTMENQNQYYGGPPTSEDPEVVARWSLVDSIGRAPDMDAPALFVTGSKDWFIIEDQQELFADALRLDGQVARTEVIEGGGHGFDLGGQRLTRLGERAAGSVLAFLNDVFPQDPARPAQSGEVDLASAPTATGSPATTHSTRVRPPRPSTTWGQRRTATTYEPVYELPTSAPPTTPPPTVEQPPPTTVVTNPPTTEPPPPTTVAPTTVAPPEESP